MLMRVMFAAAALFVATLAPSADVSPTWPPDPSQWSFTGPQWLFNTSNESEYTPPAAPLLDNNFAFYTEQAPASFNATFEWRWPYHGSDGWGQSTPCLPLSQAPSLTPGSGAGTASFIFAATNASDHYEITTPVVGQTYAKDVFWITLSRISPRTASWRVVLWEEQLASVDSVPGVWHTTSVEVEAGDTPTVRVHVDGQPMQPLRHGMLLKDGSTLDLEAVGRGGRIGFAAQQDVGVAQKSAFRDPHLTTTESAPPPPWGPADADPPTKAYGLLPLGPNVRGMSQIVTRGSGADIEGVFFSPQSEPKSLQDGIVHISDGGRSIRAVPHDFPPHLCLGSLHWDEDGLLHSYNLVPTNG